MRATEFVYGILDRFSPMSEKSSVELKTDAEKWVYEHENQVKEIDKATADIAHLEAKLETENLTEDHQLKIMETIEDLKKNLRPKTLAHKFVSYADNWIFRTGLAILFIYLVPIIQGYLNPEKPEQVEYDEEEED